MGSPGAYVDGARLSLILLSEFLGPALTIVIGGHYLHGLSYQFTDDFAGRLQFTRKIGRQVIWLRAILSLDGHFH